MSMYDYGECHVCGKPIKERRVKQEFWVKGKLIVMENVPAGVCPQCGEKVVRADIGRQIAVLLKESKQCRTGRTISVPVIRFTKEVA